MTAPRPAVDALTARFVAALGRRGAMAELMTVACLAGPPRLATAPAELPVLAHLDDALVRVADDVDDDLRDALALLGARAAWTPPGGDAAGAGMLEGYARATLREDGDEGVSLGLVLLGPGVTYPAHHHPAEEYYLPLGAIRWDHGDGWVDEPAGELIHHEPWQAHAMAVDERPVLLAYLWFGEVTVPSTLVER